MSLSVRPSVCLSVCLTFLTMFLPSYHDKIFSNYHWQIISTQKFKVDLRSMLKVRCQILSNLSILDGDNSSFKGKDAYEIMHQASRSKYVSYNFARSRVQVPSQGHTGHIIANLATFSAFPSDNLSFNSHMAMKWYSKLPATHNGCPIVFQSHSLTFKVTQEIANLARISPFSDDKLSFNTQIIAMKWRTKLFFFWGGGGGGGGGTKVIPFWFSRSSV